MGIKTPISDFLSSYTEKSPIRMHMPGHKGVGNIEKYDITEVFGADSLYEAQGIIKESEELAGSLFGADTFYSAEGSSLSVRAMLYLINLHAKSIGSKTKILAGRNAHKTFIGAAALLDADIEWLMPKEDESYISCTVTADDLRARFDAMEKLPIAVYLTSPDYLGNMADIASLSHICHEYGVLLAVDNAHGAYLKFLPESMHPIDLGADIVCDSAHKTLPTLTGGAYLHISKKAPAIFRENAKCALALFGSTSPSYLILASLDRTNAYIADGYPKKLAAFIDKINGIKERLIAAGYTLCGNEPMKITLSTKTYGYYGAELARILRENGIECEFADPDFLVLMPTPETSDEEIKITEDALKSIPKKASIQEHAPNFSTPEKALSAKEALLSPSEELPTEKCKGRTLAAVTVGCPPAVPILISGEIIDENAIKCFEYYNINELKVIKHSK